MRSDRERLLDIIEAIDRIAIYTQRGRADFESQELVQTWVIHHLEIMGEAAGRISTELRRAQPGVPWTKWVAMRNVLAHDYFGIDIERVWVTVERDLPVLRARLEAVLRKLPEP